MRKLEKIIKLKLNTLIWIENIENSKLTKKKLDISEKNKVKNYEMRYNWELKEE